ncbi:RDD family protein [Umboniibacter marinipuniceus]|uniref:RDD family protein n=1 Tax=Umboniibacter marinipuniceus TaxID=569599 RepID=A0A3M0A589_9GAMM|nr:RDD family protein [Umboniibacter marinipuniceus]RMA79940.1 RDD family protein [Umboniibacter marinipuniceus]
MLTPTDYENMPSGRIWRRVAALAYDTLLVMALSLAYFGVVTLIAYQFQTTPAEGDYGVMYSDAWKLILFAGWVVVVILFFGLFWTRNGQTLGMQAWKLRVQKPSGELISWRESVCRFAVVGFGVAVLLAASSLESTILSWLAYGIFVVNYAACLFAKKDSLTDIISATRVVEVPKDQRIGVKSGGVF